jgi:hypothetical protein
MHGIHFMSQLKLGLNSRQQVSVDDAGSYLPIVRTASCCCVETEAAPVEAKGGADLPLPCPARRQVLGLQRLHSFAGRQLRAPNNSIEAELAAIAGTSSVGKSGLPFIEYRAS